MKKYLTSCFQYDKETKSEHAMKNKRFVKTKWSDHRSTSYAYFFDHKDTVTISTYGTIRIFILRHKAHNSLNIFCIILCLWLNLSFYFSGKISKAVELFWKEIMKTIHTGSSLFIRLIRRPRTDKYLQSITVSISHFCPENPELSAREIPPRLVPNKLKLLNMTRSLAILIRGAES